MIAVQTNYTLVAVLGSILSSLSLRGVDCGIRFDGGWDRGHLTQASDSE